MKKIAVLSFLFVVGVVCAVVFVSSRTKPLNNLINKSPENIMGEVAELKSYGEEAYPFKNGCYVGEDYVLDLTFTGRENENIYNAVLRRKDTGEKLFAGVAFDVKDDAESILVPSSEKASAVLKLSRSNTGDTLSLDFYYGENRVDYVGGEYSLSAGEWIPELLINSEYFSAGDYYSENGVYALNICEGQNSLLFAVSNISENRTVFEARLPVRECEDGECHCISSALLMNSAVQKGSPTEGVALPASTAGSSSQQIEFTNDIRNGVQCVKINCYGSSGVEYTGNYIYDGGLSIDPGEYVMGDRTVKVTKSTVNATGDSGEYRYSICMTMTDSHGNLLFKGAKELSEKDGTALVSFYDGDEELSFYKGVENDCEYLEILNFGYLNAVGVCERYDYSKNTVR